MAYKPRVEHLLEIQQFEFNQVLLEILSHTRVRNWGWIKDKDPELFEHIEQQLRALNRDSK